MNMIVVSCLLSLTISYLPLLSEYVEISNLSAILEKVFSMQSLFEYSLRKHFISMRSLHLILSVNQNHLCSTSSILFLLFYWQQSLLICQLLFLTVLKQIEVYLEPSRISFCETNNFHKYAPSQMFSWVLNKMFAREHYCNSNISCVFKTEFNICD